MLPFFYICEKKKVNGSVLSSKLLDLAALTPHSPSFKDIWVFSSLSSVLL